MCKRFSGETGKSAAEESCHIEDADTEAADEDTFDYEEAYEETSDKETEDMLNEEGDQE